MMFFLSDEMPLSFEEWLLFGAASGGKLVEDTATGNPLTFTTDVAKALKSLSIPFLPVQSGTGDPSPSNVRNIVPWNGLTVGQSRWLYIEQGEYNYTYGYKQDSSTRIRSDYIPVNAGTYTISCKGMNNIVMYVFDTSKRFLVSESQRIWTNTTFTFTITEDRLVAFVWRKTGDVEITPSDISNVILNVNTTEHYDSITETDIVFPSPVYGGEHEAVSGKMNVPVAFAEFDGSDNESWNVGAIDANKSRAFIALAGAPKSGYNRDIIGNYIKPTASAQSSPDLWTANINASGNILIGIDPSITTVEAWKAYLAEHPLQIVYPLATPQEIQLTPQQITALVGNNTIWSDADGSMTAVFFKKG